MSGYMANLVHPEFLQVYKIGMQYSPCLIFFVYDTVERFHGCSDNKCPFLSAGYARSTQPAGPKITLHFLCLFVSMYVSLCVPTYHVHNNY